MTSEHDKLEAEFAIKLHGLSLQGDLSPAEQHAAWRRAAEAR